MAMNVGTLRGFLELEDNFSPKLQQAGRLVADSGDKWTRTGQQMQSAGARMTVGITAPLVAAGGAAIKFATDMNAGMANVATLIPGNVDRVQELKAEVQDLAIETGKSTTDLSDGLFQTISAFGDSAAAAAILGINAKAAAAGLATTTDAINLTSAVTKGYGDTSAAAVQQAADLAFMTNKLGQTTFPELAGSIGRVVPLAAELNVSQQDLFGTMATFTGVTGNAAEVSTQLRGVLQGLLSPTDTMKDLFGQLGVESGKALIEQRGLSGAIQAVVAAANAGDADLADYLGSIEGQTLALAATGSQADTYAQKLAAMSNVVGAADQAFIEQTQGINAAGFTWQQFQQRMAVAAQTLGDVLLPIAMRFLTNVAEPLLGWITSAVDWFGRLPQPIQTAGVAIAGIAAAAGPVIVAVGTLLSSFGAVASVVGPLITSLGGAGLGGAVASLAAGLLGPVGLVAAVTAASVATGSWINENVIGKHALADFLETIGLAEPAVQLTAAELANMRDRQQEVTTASTEAAGAVATVVTPTFDAGAAAATTAAELANLGVGMGTTGGAADTLKDKLGRLGLVARSDVEPTMNDLRVAVASNEVPAAQVIAKARELEARWKELGILTPALTAELTKLRTEAMLLDPAFANLKPPIDDVIKSITDGIPFMDDAGDVMAEFDVALPDPSTIPTKPLGSFFTQFQTGVPFLDNALSSLSGFVSKGLGGLTDALGGLFGGAGGGGLFDSILGGLTGALTGGGGLSSALSGLLGTGLSAVMGPLGGLVSSGITKLGGLIFSGIKKLFGGPTAEELAGRQVAAEYRNTIATMLGATQQAEVAQAVAGGASQQWAQEVIGIRDAFLAMGRTEQEALAISQQLWEAEKQGPEAVQAVIAQIAPTLDSVTAAMQTTGMGLTELRDFAINAATVMQVSVADAFSMIASGAITSMADAHAAASQAMSDTATAAAGAVATASSEMSAATQAQAQQALNDAEDAKLAIAQQAQEAEAAAHRIAGLDIRVPVTFEVSATGVGTGGGGGGVPGFEGGTDFDFLDFGREGADVRLHGDEAVIKRSQGDDLMDMVRRGISDGDADRRRRDRERDGVRRARRASGGRGAGGGFPEVLKVIVQLPNGKVLAEEVIEHMPRMLSHRGLDKRN